MYNNLFKIGSLTIHGYGLMIGIGIIVALLMSFKRAKKKGLDPDMVYNIGLIALIFGFIGSKFLYFLVDIKYLINHPIEILLGSGFVLYGGILGGILAVIIYCKIKNIDFLKYFDLMIPSVAIAQGFGRIGCFLAGCCYGRETNSPIGIVFHNSALAPNGVKLIPTQLFSSAGDFLIGIILIIYAKKERKSGKVGALYLILYSIGRFVIEFFRDDYRGSIGFLSTSQFISLLVLVTGIVMFFTKKQLWFKKEN